MLYFLFTARQYTPVCEEQIGVLVIRQTCYLPDLVRVENYEVYNTSKEKENTTLRRTFNKQMNSRLTSHAHGLILTSSHPRSTVYRRQHTEKITGATSRNPTKRWLPTAVAVLLTFHVGRGTSYSIRVCYFVRSTFFANLQDGVIIACCLLPPSSQACTAFTSTAVNELGHAGYLCLTMSHV